MPIRDILFPMLSYPVMTATDSIEKAVAMAAGFGAHISALVLELDIHLPVGLYARPPELGGRLAAEQRKSANQARDLVASFEAAGSRQGALGGGAKYDHAVERCKWADIPKVLVDHARLRDLSIFPVNPEDGSQLSLLEALIFESGRPVLLLPEGTTRQLSTAPEIVAVAWDHSAPAARAVADSLPILQAAKRVHVLTVVDEKRLHNPGSGAELCKHLARHGVEVTFDQVQAKGRPIGEVLEGHVVERKIDLLVMGSYGHSRLREFVLGGATRRVLTRPFTWTLLSH
jgi:nucleotide-binding universal stress UspA family protein